MGREWRKGARQLWLCCARLPPFCTPFLPQVLPHTKSQQFYLQKRMCVSKGVKTFREGATSVAIVLSIPTREFGNPPRPFGLQMHESRRLELSPLKTRVGVNTRKDKLPMYSWNPILD